MQSAGRSSGFADDEFRVDLHEVWRWFAGKFFEEHLGGGAAHLPERLTNGGEAWDLIGGRLDVVEAEDGYVGRHVETGLVEGADAAHGGDVVEAKDCGKRAMALDELADAGVADLWRVRVDGEMDGEIFVDFEAEIAGRLEGCGPADIGVGAEGLALDESYFAVTELMEMAECELRCLLVIEDDIGDVG